MKTCEIVLEELSVQQLDELLEIEQLCFSYDRFSRRNLRNLLKSPSAYCVGMRCDGMLVGSMVVLFSKNTRSARLYSMAIFPEFRGKGLGSRFLEDAEQEARRRGCIRMRLEVRMDNIPAIRMYEGHGFVSSQILPGYYEDGTHGMLYRKVLAEKRTPQ